jgi:iron complex outermembrane receptor protein
MQGEEIQNEGGKTAEPVASVMASLCRLTGRLIGGSKVKKRFLGGIGWLMVLQLGVVPVSFAQDAATPAGESDLDSVLGPSPAQTAAPAAPAQPAQPVGTAPAAEAQSATAPAAPLAAQPADAGSPQTEAAASGPRAGPKNRLTEEIIVTAEKREQNLQEVPASVQAFTGGTLDAKGVSDIKDLQLVTPGLQFDSMASYSIIFIRGIGGDAFQAGVDSSVATYVDGLYLPFTFSSAEALGDVSQIEVLKGPQGTLYGRNAVAGAITIKLKEPSKDFNASIFQQNGDYHDTRTKLAVSGAIPFTNQTLTASASALYEDHDSYDKDYYKPNQPYHHYRTFGLRGAFKWEPLDDFDVQGSMYYIKDQNVDSVATVLLSVAPAFTQVVSPLDVPHYVPDDNNTGENGVTRVENLTFHYKPDTTDIKLILGHSRAYSNILFNYVGSPEPVLDISALPNKEHSASGELILTSNPSDTPDWLEYIGGAYYENTTKSGQYIVKGNAIDEVIGVPLGAQTDNGTIPLTPLLSALQSTGIYTPTGSSPLCGLYTSLGGNCSLNSNTDQGNPIAQVALQSQVNNRDLSLYGQITFHVTDQISAVAGSRFSEEKVSLDYSNVGLALTGIPLLPNNTTPQFEPIVYRPEATVYNSFTPNLGLNFKVLDNVLLYYKYSEAYKSGNYNGLNLNLPPARVNPEEASGNEAGFKTELLPDRTLKLNGSLFTTTVTNAQVQTLSLISGGVTTLQNAAAYTVRGGELEVNWFLTESLVYFLNGDVLHGRYGSFVGQGFPAPLYVNDNDTNFAGKKTVRTPTWTFTTGLNYTYNLPFGLTGEASGDVYYTSGYKFTAENDVGQPAYFILNARLGVFDPRSNIRVTLYGKNLSNATFYSNKYTDDFGVVGFYGAPRTFGGQLAWSFGN